MSHVTNLSDDFDEKFANITARLREKVTWKQYGEIVNCFKDKKLAGATRHIEHIAKDQDKHVSMTSLALLRKYARSWNTFYRDVVNLIDDFEEFMEIVYDWRDLMERNGGPKQAARLARQRDRELPFTPPHQFVIIGERTTVPVRPAGR